MIVFRFSSSPFFFFFFFNDWVFFLFCFVLFFLSIFRQRQSRFSSNTRHEIALALPLIIIALCSSPCFRTWLISTSMILSLVKPSKSQSATSTYLSWQSVRTLTLTTKVVSLGKTFLLRKAFSAQFQTFIAPSITASDGGRQV